MYHYDPKTALEEVKEEAALPNPVHMRDMILRARLTPDRSLELNRQFLQRAIGEEKGHTRRPCRRQRGRPAISVRTLYKVLPAVT